MIRRRITAVTAATCLFVPSTALADISPNEQARIRKVASSYAACVVKRHHAKASEAILATASNVEINGKLAQILDGSCLSYVAGEGAEMRFKYDTYQYALADALVAADLGTKEFNSFADRLPLAQPPVISDEQASAMLAKEKSKRKRKEVEADISKRRGLAYLSRFGECVARGNPAAVRYLLLTPPATPEETSRLKALQPVFDECLGAGTAKFNRITIRGSVAVNYYRLAMATAIPVAGSVH